MKHVAIDFRLNKGGIKFQPDLVALASLDGPPVLFVDYESPNSSDIRIPTKDIKAYNAWSKKEGKRVPYLVVTTLPDRPSDVWELRYTSKGAGNAGYKGRRDAVRKNPHKFWYSEYKKKLKAVDCRQIYIVNISDNKVRRVPL